MHTCWQPYDVVFPGETVQVISGQESAPGEETLAYVQSGGVTKRFAVRAKIAGLKHNVPRMSDSATEELEVRGWISLEEQEQKLAKRRTGKCCCLPKRRQMHIVNGSPVLPADLGEDLNAENLYPALQSTCILEGDERGQHKIQRKLQYARLSKDSFALTFQGELAGTEHVKSGQEVVVRRFASVTRGKFGGQLLEMDSPALDYQRQEDGKYFAWEWSFAGREQWQWFNPVSSAMLHAAKEKALELKAAGTGPQRPRELKENQGFSLGPGMAPEDYKFDPLRVDASGRMCLQSKQSKRR